MTRFPRKVTTPQVMPSGTGYTVSMKSSKNIGTLLLMKMPTRMQEVYKMAVNGKNKETAVSTISHSLIGNHDLKEYQIPLL